jgi:hypothetical protein
MPRRRPPLPVAASRPPASSSRRSPRLPPWSRRLQLPVSACQRFQVVRFAGRAGRATSRLIAIRTTTRTINRLFKKLFRLFKKLFRFHRQIFRPRCRYFGFLFRYFGFLFRYFGFRFTYFGFRFTYFGFLFTYFGFRFTYFGFPFRISVQRNPFIFLFDLSPQSAPGYFGFLFRAYIKL